MSTIINGRGIVSKYDPDKKPDIDPDYTEEEFKPMTIEEYRNLKFTAEQEWNELYCPKRSSIEA